MKGYRAMGVKVVKFGGSSLADANQIKKAAAIIKADPDRRFVVPSAPGKRYDADIKVTDMLYACYEKASKGQDFSEDFQMIKNRYNGIIADLAWRFTLRSSSTRSLIGSSLAVNVVVSSDTTFTV